MKKLLILLCLVLCAGCVNKTKANEIYTAYLGASVPYGTKFYEAKSNKLLGDVSNLVFTMYRDAFDEIVKDYVKKDKESALVGARDWLPSDIIKSKSLECYYRFEEKDNNKREYYLFWNDDNGRIYFLTYVY